MPRRDPERRGWLAAGGALALSILSPGCSRVGQDHDGPLAPREQAIARPVGTAWVFSSGGPRGFQHVGVVKALEELGLAPDLIVGSSIGALIGVLCAGGVAAPALEDLALDVKPWALADLAIGADEWLSGRPLAELVRRRLPASPLLERLMTPVAVVAARARDRRIAAFTAGDAGLAVMASTAIEGRFAPVSIRGERYVDPDLVMPMPVRVARRLGAVRVLAVDASAHEDRAPPDIGEYRQGDLRKRELTAPDARLADLVIHPDPGYWAGLSREYRLRAIETGYRETMRQAEAVRAIHAPQPVL